MLGCPGLGRLLGLIITCVIHCSIGDIRPSSDRAGSIVDPMPCIVTQSLKGALLAEVTMWPQHSSSHRYWIWVGILLGGIVICEAVNPLMHQALTLALTLT